MIDTKKVAWCVELACEAHKLAKTCDRISREHSIDSQSILPSCHLVYPN